MKLNKCFSSDVPLMVTIRCIAYNHGPYIRQCLEGFVMQKTNFRFEAIVHDDASTDSTATIIREYAEKYPNIIKPIFETENQYSKYDGSLQRIMDHACMHGKYVALCEGDDYWIDPYKLQKQVDFLESHPEYIYSCHRYNILDMQTHEYKLASNIYFDKHPSDSNFTFGIDYPFLTEWITKTLTCLYRNNIVNFPYSTFKYFRDVHRVYFILKHGKGVCHSFVGGVYRISPVGVFSMHSNIEKANLAYKIHEELYEKTHDKIFKKLMLDDFARKIYFSRRFIWPHNFLELKCYFIYLPLLTLRKCYRRCIRFFASQVNYNNL